MNGKQKRLSGHECFRIYPRLKDGSLEYIGGFSLKDILKGFIAKYILTSCDGEEYLVEMMDAEENITSLGTIMNKEEVRREWDAFAKRIKKRAEEQK